VATRAGAASADDSLATDRALGATEVGRLGNGMVAVAAEVAGAALGALGVMAGLIGA